MAKFDETLYLHITLDAQEVINELLSLPMTVLPSEAIYAFMGWLTTRAEVAGPFSSAHNASPIVPLINEFCLMQEWDLPGEYWYDKIKPFCKGEGDNGSQKEA